MIAREGAILGDDGGGGPVIGIEVRARLETSAPPSVKTESTFWHLRPRCRSRAIHGSCEREQPAYASVNSQKTTDFGRKFGAHYTDW